MDDLIFDVTIDEENRYVAQAREDGIATDAASWEELKTNVRALISACYEGAERPKQVHLVLDQVLAVA